MQLDDAVRHRQIVARLLGPAPAVEVVHWTGRVRDRVVRVAAADRVAAELRRVADRPRLDLLRAAEERLAPPLRQLREVVRPIDPLQGLPGGGASDGASSGAASRNGAVSSEQHASSISTTRHMLPSISQDTVSLR